MKWIAISGSWRVVNKKVEKDVRNSVSEILKHGDGIIDGGAPGVDYIATDQALMLDSRADKVRVYLPTSLKFYVQHTKRRSKEGVIKKKIANDLIKQLTKAHKINPFCIIEGKDIVGNKYVEKWQYSKRNGVIIRNANRLLAFHVNASPGTADAIKRAKLRNIPIKIFSYKIRASNSNSNEGSTSKS